VPNNTAIIHVTFVVAAVATLSSELIIKAEKIPIWNNITGSQTNSILHLQLLYIAARKWNETYA
jgi:hypothetical protein